MALTARTVCGAAQLGGEGAGAVYGVSGFDDFDEHDNDSADHHIDDDNGLHDD